MHSFMAVHGGKIIAEGYWKPFHKDMLHRIYSSTKSFVSIAIGFLEAEGKISLSDTVISFFQEKLPKNGVHPYIAKATIRDLLMMASPHEKTTYKLMDWDDWTKTFFAYPPSHLPGTVFSYDTSATHVLGALVEKISDMTFIEYLRPRLLDHLGFTEEVYCLKDPAGISWSGSGLLCTTRDFAKVALTCMHGGRFEGKQLIPEDYIRAATSKQISNFVTGLHIDGQQGYGYQFWCLRNNAFGFFGMGGQLAICIPDKDFLMVITADYQFLPAGHAVILNAIWDELYPYLSVTGSLSADRASYCQLQEKLESLTLVTVEGGYASPVAASVSGKEFHMDSNPMGFQTVRFEFKATGGAICFKKETGDFVISFGYGENVAQRFPEYNYESLASAAWWNDQTLNMACFTIGEFCAPLRMTAFFREDTVTIHMQNAAELFMEEYSGFACGHCW